MKHIYFIFFFLYFSQTLFSQELFEFEYSTDTSDVVPFTIIESNNNYFIGIYNHSDGITTSHIIKLDNNGDFEIKKDFPQKRIFGIKEINSNIFCYGYNELTDSVSVFFMTLDENLHVVRNNSYSIVDYPIHNTIYDRSVFIEKNDIIHCIYNCQYQESFIFSTNANCDSIDSFSFKGYCFDICKNPLNDGFLMTGANFSIPNGHLGIKVAFTNSNLRIYKVDSINILPSYYITGAFIEPLNKNIVFSGLDENWNENRNDLISIAVFDTTMTIQSYAIVGTVDYNNWSASANGLAVDNSQYIYSLSTINDKNGEPYRIYDNWLMLTKTDSLQNVIWEKYYGGDAFYQANSFILCNDGGIVLASTKYDHEISYYNNVYIFKVNSEGNPSINLSVKNSVKSRELIIYPNPAKNNLTIRTAVQRIGGIISIYSISGKLIFQKSISKTITNINVANLPKGTYIFKYTVKGKKIESGKFIKK